MSFQSIAWQLMSEEDYGAYIEEKMNRDDYLPEEWDEICEEYADPGSNSALRAASKDNPRNLPCPTCGEPNRLTPKDVALGYQCNACADQAERGGW